MDDKTPTPDQTPDHTPQHTPESAPDAQTVPVTPTPGDAAQPVAPAAATAPAPAESKPGRKRALLIGGGIAAAIVLAGGGIAIGAVIGDEFDDDDRSSVSDGAHHNESTDDDASDDTSHDNSDHDDSTDDGGASSNGGGPATGIGTASADELIEIADAARSAADGDVTSIDAKRDGTWEVQLTNAAGDETEVRVDEDLAASVISTDPADGDDTGASLTLDDETIRALVTAALAEADGMIIDLDVDGDDVSPYDASVLTSDNRSIDIDFSAEFAVTGTDIDD